MTMTILPTGRTQANFETISRLVAATPAPTEGTSSIGLPINSDGFVVQEQNTGLAGYVEALKFPDGQVIAGNVYCANPRISLFATEIENALDQISPVAIGCAA